MVSESNSLLLSLYPSGNVSLKSIELARPVKRHGSNEMQNNVHMVKGVS